MGGTGSGNKPLKKKTAIVVPATLHCLCCGGCFNINELYDSDSELHKATCKIPYCKDCINKLYQNYLKKYKAFDYKEPERKAVERICMVLDVYYNNNIFDSAVKELDKRSDTPLVLLYFKQAKLYQYRNKNYDTTIHEKHIEYCDNDTSSDPIFTEEEVNQNEEIKDAMKFFGSGFTEDDYKFLIEQYADWTTRHECETKSQEEIFKRICFKQLEILKATRRGDDTKDLDATFQKLLETAKLQPKQNSGETTANSQTFGTLIDKWENTRPIPEIDEDLRDVDKIGLLIHVFYTGHIAKVLNLKSSITNLYDKFIKKYTVEKQEYSSESDNEVLFDSIFGKKNIDE